jgi:hypothetical protein
LLGIFGIMKIRRVRSLGEYELCQLRSHDERKALRDFELECEKSGEKKFRISGFSYTAGSEVQFLVDYQSSVGGRINWRERVICPVSHLNNRLRASVHLLDIELAPYKDDRIFLSEQVTPLYNFLRPRYPNVVGSEYLGPHRAAGSLNDDGIRHEDLTSLSFDRNSLDYILSFDCFEHFPRFDRAFMECARVLRPGGKMFWSVPFVTTSQANITRARVINGEIEHVLPPEYHGDPVNTQGCLCYTHFGWEMLEQVRQSGFSDAYAIPYGSREFGYLGASQIVFVAEK